MNWLRHITFSISSIFILVMMMGACTSRVNPPEIDNDSTLVYLSKRADDISAKITLCRKIDSRSAERVGVGTVFTSMEKGNIYALVDLHNDSMSPYKNLLIHLDWIGTNQRSLYRKRIDFIPGESSSTIKTSISSDNRKPGEYLFRVYLFRELIAVKRFQILPDFDSGMYQPDLLSSNITLCNKTSKRFKKCLGNDSVFIIKDNAKVRAVVDLGNRNDFGDRELIFRFNWVGVDTIPFYRKRISLAKGDSSSIIGSSISINPGKRKPGEYFLKLYLFNKLIGQSKFELLPEPKIIPIQANRIKADIILYRKLDKRSGERVDAGTQFKLKNKRKVRAFVNISNRNKYSDRELKFRIDWIGPDGKSFYGKSIVLACDESILKSSISIAPAKRTPGRYCFRLTFSKEIVLEKTFEILPGE